MMLCRRKVIMPLFLAAAVAAAVMLTFGGTVRADAGHSFTAEDCSSCHLQDGAGGARAMTFPRADISAECVVCHSSCDVGLGHAGEREDTEVMSQRLPLVGDTRINCVTCHRIHDAPGGRSPESGAGRLRISNLKRGLCLNCHLEERGRTARVRITAPTPSAVIQDARVPFIGRIENLTESHVTLKVNEAEFPLRVNGGHFHTRIRVEEGMNRIELSLHGQQLWVGKLFRGRQGERVTYNGGKFSGHQTDSIDECLGCHLQEDGLLQAATPALPGLCYGCHEPFDEKKYLHGPLAVGECTSCHDPHGGTGPYHLVTREVSLCLSCHGEEEVLGHRGGREAMAEGSCSVCHDPHQSDTRFLQRAASLQGTAD